MDQDHGDQALVAEASQEVAAERRLHMQAYNFWLDSHREEGLPDAADLMTHPECAFADNCILIEVGDDDAPAQLVTIGGNLPDDGLSLPVAVDEVDGRSLISRVSEHVMQPVANRAPVGFEADFRDQNDNRLSYRAIALPCATDGVTIDSVLGVISFKLRDEDGAEQDQSKDSPASQDDAETANSDRDAYGQDKAAARKGGDAVSETADDNGKRENVMNFKEKLKECIEIDGAIAVALFDLESGMPIATEQAGRKTLDLEVAAAGNTNVLRAKYATMKELGIDEKIEDILITLESQIHMIRPATSESGTGLILYLALDKAKANLAMARMKLRQIEKGIEL